MHLVEKIIMLSKKTFEFLNKNKVYWYSWSETFWKAIEKEIKEAKEVLDNKVYLEDELWDVLRDYLCLLYALESEGKITSAEKVFERCWRKFSERVNVEDGSDNWDWEKIKRVQKERLKKEAENM